MPLRLQEDGLNGSPACRSPLGPRLATGTCPLPKNRSRRLKLRDWRNECPSSPHCHIAGGFGRSRQPFPHVEPRRIERRETERMGFATCAFPAALLLSPPRYFSHISSCLPLSMHIFPNRNSARRCIRQRNKPKVFYRSGVSIGQRTAKAVRLAIALIASAKP